MAATSNISIDEIPWQAKLTGFIFKFKDHLKNSSEVSCPNTMMSKKDLTKEAGIMIFVLLAFTLLSILGSGTTIYEYFLINNDKRNKSQMNKKEKNSVNRASLENWKCFLKLFCIVKNGRRILNTDSSERQIDFIQGLRFFFSAWIILIHIVVFYFPIVEDAENAKSFLELRVSHLLLNGDFTVDTFFVISGFLNAYNFFPLYRYCNGNINWVYFYLKRFIRLTPVYMIVLGFYTNLFSYTGTGIIWPTFNTNQACWESWWWYVLYINNYSKSAMQCMVWCWQLAVDMQLYIVSPLFFISLIRWPRIGYFLIFICIVVSCAASFLLTYWLDLSIGFSEIVLHLANLGEFYKKHLRYAFLLHMQPYARLSSYLIGILLGHFLYKKNLKENPIKNNKVTLWFGWITTASFIWMSFFHLHNNEVSLMERALYNTTKSLFPSCCMAWIIYLCLTGQAGFLNCLLSWRFLFPLGRLSYCAYLIHMIILMRGFFQTEDLIHFNIMELMWLFAYTCMLTYLVSFMVSMLFEMPVLNLLDSFSKKRWGRNTLDYPNYQKNQYTKKTS